jgi:hypothetical protein
MSLQDNRSCLRLERIQRSARYALDGQTFFTLSAAVRRFSGDKLYHRRLPRMNIANKHRMSLALPHHISDNDKSNWTAEQNCPVVESNKLCCRRLLHNCIANKRMEISLLVPHTAGIDIAIRQAGQTHHISVLLYQFVSQALSKDELDRTMNPNKDANHVFFLADILDRYRATIPSRLKP